MYNVQTKYEEEKHVNSAGGNDTRQSLNGLTCLYPMKLHFPHQTVQNAAELLNWKIKIANIFLNHNQMKALKPTDQSALVSITART